MKVYIPKKEYKFNHPEDMEKILKYLKEHGEIKVTPKTIEDFYYDFSDTHCAGWLCVDDEHLEEFAEYLSEIEL